MFHPDAEYQQENINSPNRAQLELIVRLSRRKVIFGKL